MNELLVNIILYILNMCGFLAFVAFVGAVFMICINTFLYIRKKIRKHKNDNKMEWDRQGFPIVRDIPPPPPSVAFRRNIL